MPFVLGESLLGYDIFGTRAATYVVTLYQPDAMLWEAAYFGDMQFGSTAPSDYYIETEIETVIE